MRPNSKIEMHKCFFEQQGLKVKEAIAHLMQKNSLNDADIQAVKCLLDVYDALTNPLRESRKYYRED